MCYNAVNCLPEESEPIGLYHLNENAVYCWVCFYLRFLKIHPSIYIVVKNNVEMVSLGKMHVHFCVCVFCIPCAHFVDKWKLLLHVSWFLLHAVYIKLCALG